jgi:hypothetical protein
MKNAVFWDVTPCGSCRNQRFEGTYYHHRQGKRIREQRKALAVAAAVVYTGYIYLLLQVL